MKYHRSECYQVPVETLAYFEQPNLTLRPRISLIIGMPLIIPFKLEKIQILRTNMTSTTTSLRIVASSRTDNDVVATWDVMLARDPSHSTTSL